MNGDRRSSNYRVDVSGGVTGQVAVGQDIQQTSIEVGSPGPTQDELAELKNVLRELRARVSDEAPAAARDAAIERVDELKEAITAPAPDLSTMEYVKGWFARHVPKLAGLITGVIVNPIVGKLVAAGGDALVAEFQQRFEHD